MDIGIVGLPGSGKTTIFNAVTRGNAKGAPPSGPRAKPNLGVAKVPDPRLDSLKDIFNAKRIVPAEVTYVDVPPAPEGFGKTRGISGEFLNHLQSTDALLLVVRTFEDPSVPHVEETIDPIRDAETMLYELSFADLEILDRRLERVAQGFKGTKPVERDALNKEKALLERLKEALEASVPVRDQTLNEDETRHLQGFQFLTAKPLVVVANVGEDQLVDSASMQDRLSRDFAGPRIRMATLCGKLEAELGQMEPAEEQEFRQSLELEESCLTRMIGLSYDVMDLITFFTGNSNEVRAWPVPRGTTALKAAGRIHTDFGRGFIRAEVVRHRDIEACGGMAESRKRGLLRQEGKTYVVNDGDVINVLFNV